jgi:glyoxylase-like metal-dependent hydrolase (beta-lactamase superfamily II)
MPIFKNSGLISGNLHLVDLMQFNTPKVTSAFVYSGSETSIIMDTGTSLNVDAVLNFLDAASIPKSSVRWITGTHYHFDHMGGATELWQRLKVFNPEVKIAVPEDMMYMLQNSALHLQGAKTTFGPFIGTMEPAPESAFEPLKKNHPYTISGNAELTLVQTPGHTPDHCSPTLHVKGEPVFTFAGESCGCLYHQTRIISSPTSMPPNFSYEAYIASLDRVLALEPDIIGFCHFGALRGREKVKEYITLHREEMAVFRDTVDKAYRKSGSVKEAIDATVGLIKEGFDPSAGIPEAYYKNLTLGLVYGMLIDLGHREPKYEPRNPAADEKNT